MRNFKLLFVLLMVFSFQLVNAQKTITGTITSSEDAMTLPGVSVVVKGTTLGTITDIDGKYSIDVPEDAVTLVFTYVGMVTEEMEIGANSVIDVALVPDIMGLDEVVVTAIGITREKKALGYAVQSIDADDIANSSATDVVNTLSGRTAGVQVNASGGSAGASTFITIRGAASIEGDNQPLFVIDGVPVENEQMWGGSEYETEGVNASSRTIDINPDDIESMSVLKGGAATALYGLRAANGAIIITTKKGKQNQQMEISLHTSVSFDVANKFPERQKKFAQGLGGEFQSGYNGNWGPRMDTLVYSQDTLVWENPGFDVDGQLVSANFNSYDHGLTRADGSDATIALGAPVKAYDPYDFFQTGITYNTNLSLATGSEKTTYYFSVGDKNQEGIIPNNTFRRTAVRFNATTKLNDRITTGANMSYTHSDGNFIQNGSNISGVMLGLLRTPASFDNAAGYEFADGTQRNYRGGGGYDNPYWTANNIYFADVVNRIMGDAHLNIFLTDWMNLRYKVGLDWYSRHYKDRFAVNSRAFPNGRLEERFYTSRMLNQDVILNMNRDLTSFLGMNLNVGFNMYEDYKKDLLGLASSLTIPGFDQVGNTNDQGTAFAERQYRTSAVFVDASFDLMNMVYLGATVRNEWSTTMPEDHLSEMYYSTNLGFIFTELPMLKDNPVLSFGKFRASYAKTANVATPYYTDSYYDILQIRDGWTNGMNFPILGYTGYTIDYLPGNSELKHETMNTTEVGAELKFLNNKIGVDFAYFYNKNTDLLIEVPVATSTGYQNLYMNAATMETKGIELMLYATPVQTADFTWDIFVNYTKMKNEVLELAEGVENVFLGGFTDPQVRAVAGMDYGTVYGFDWYRDEATGQILLNDDPDDNYPDGFPMTDTREMVPLGRVTPDWTANITNTFSFKGVSLTALFDIKHGGTMYNGTRFTMNTFGTSIETADREVTYLDEDERTIDYANTDADNIVVYDGIMGHIDDANEPVSSGQENVIQVVNDQTWYRGQGGNFGGGATTASLESSGWVRLRELTVSYALGKDLLNNIPITRAEVYFTGRNLWLNTPYTGIDPETSLTGARNSQGMDYFNNPGTRSYTFGLRLTF